MQVRLHARQTPVDAFILDPAFSLMNILNATNMVHHNVENMETIDVDEERSHAYAFNPYQRTENCFYVALSRLLGVDSTTVATWTGNDELETDDVGLTVLRRFNHSLSYILYATSEVNLLSIGMRQVIETCGLRISTPIKFVDLMNDHEDDYEDLNNSDELDFAAILRVAAKHGIEGPCLAAEVKVPGRIGHFINIQRIKPEIWHLDDTREWRDDEDANAAQDTYKLTDFQIYCHCEQTHAKLREGTVRLLMGKTQDITTVFGTELDPNWAKEPKYELMRGLRLRTEWEASEGRWKFSIRHHGEQYLLAIARRREFVWLKSFRSLGHGILRWRRTDAT